MRSEPYSIYVDRRPLRIAFLVNPDSGSPWIDKILEYTRGKWGGRFNPIILTDGNELRDYWWKFLKTYDPDVIATTVTLSEGLKRSLARSLSPLATEQIDDSHTRLRLDHYEPVGILPTSSVVSGAARDFFGAESALVMFEMADDTPTPIQDFLRRNFGLIETGPGALYHVNKALEGVKTVVYKVSDLTSLNAALLELGGYRRVVFPSQLCTIPNTFDEVDYERETNHFAVIVGDGPDELTYSWNRTLRLRSWLRTGFTYLWLPTALANEPAIKPGLTKFLTRYVDTTGDSQSGKGAHFYSFSLDDEPLAAVAQSLGGGTRFWQSSRRLLVHPAPSRSGPLFSPPSGLDPHRAHSSEEYVVVTPPDVEGAPARGQDWLADLYIEYRSERFARGSGTTHWWRLPPRNSVLDQTDFFCRSARIKADGSFSVLMGRHVFAWESARELVVKPPSDFTVAWALICAERFDDEGQSRESSRDSDLTIDLSDKGMYLSGVLGLFPDLYNASSLLEERFWRTTFEKMSNQSSAKDEEKQTTVANAVRKRIAGWQQLPTSENQVNWIAERIVSLAKDYSKEEIDLPYVSLLTAAKQEHDAYNAAHPEAAMEFQEGDFLRRVSHLLELKVLLPGIRPRCPSCGYRIWYHIDEVSQDIRCKGCQNIFTVRAEERWYYRLNSLLRAGVASHGTIPVLLLLGQLMQRARYSFLFVPPVDLLVREDDPERDRQVAELDVVCVADGRFIIGEVKKSVGLFDRADFDSLVSIAKRIKPDTVLFAALEGSPGAFIQENVKRVQDELAGLDVEVKWFPFPEWIAEPQPVR